MATDTKKEKGRQWDGRCPRPDLMILMIRT